VPVLVFTGWQGTDEKLRAFELGAADYVTKPFELAELRARVKALLRAKQLQDALLLANQELDAARARAEDIARVKTEFLARMSHEIRNPMNGVIAMSGLLQQTSLTVQQQDYVETIRASGEMALTIINDILNYSKIERGQMELESRSFDLRKCVEEAADLYAARCAEKKIELVCDLDPEPPCHLVGDVTRLRQVLINLIGNAVKFTPAGEVVVHIEFSPPQTADPDIPARGDLHLVVRDTGIGIPASRLHRLFHNFSQADSSITRQYGGTGLGLAISKGLVELMDGRIWAESIEGQGSAFHVSLSLPLDPGSDPNPVNTPQPQLAGRAILVVDDHQTTRKVLARRATEWGMVTRTAGSTAEAWEIIGNAPSDVLVVDYSLPGEGGLALIRRLRQMAGGQDLPAVLLTPWGFDPQAEEAVEAGVSSIVHKPVKPELLYDAILQALAGTRLQPRPHQAGPSPEPVLRAATPKLAATLPLRVLLADDNEINQKVFVRLLDQLGYQPDMACNGLEALAAVQRQPYDIIFMDVRMPGLDGLEATRRIRALEAQSGQVRCPVVAVTANAMPGDREACLAAGMDEYIAKPFPAEIVKSCLLRFCQQPADASALPPVASLLAPRNSTDTLPNTEPLVDMGRLLESAGDDAEEARALLNTLLQQVDAQLPAMATALEQQDAQRARDLAHKVAGASSLCGAVPLARLFRQFERDALEERFDQALEIHRQLLKEHQRLLDHLAKQPVPDTPD
jgi:signal transduction histidine kinase/two-component SAPR family response regulator/HPt (histidine-containing phosphotransfer) domain-containing protein